MQYDVELVQNKITKLLEKYNSGLWMSKLSEVYSEMFGQKLHPQALVDLKKWTHIVMVGHLLYIPPLFIIPPSNKVGIMKPCKSV